MDRKTDPHKEEKLYKVFFPFLFCFPLFFFHNLFLSLFFFRPFSSVLSFIKNLNFSKTTVESPSATEDMETKKTRYDAFLRDACDDYPKSEILAAFLLIVYTPPIFFLFFIFSFFCIANIP